jgi:diguanylate cyclase (GGDEF)-like protein
MKRVPDSPYPSAEVKERQLAPCVVEPSSCLWSENSKFCRVLYNASVPLDNKWPLLILELRGIGEKTTLSEIQKSQMQEILLRILQEKNYTETRYGQIQKEIFAVSHAPYEQKLREITREVDSLILEIHKILGKRHQEMAFVADSVDQDLHRGTDPEKILSRLRRALRNMAEQMESDTEVLLTLSRKDSLTGLANRRSFDEFLEKSAVAWQQDKTPVALIYFDVDFFKKFNDTYGHLVGDQVLRTLATQMRKVLEFQEKEEGGEILSARYGGEEFSIIMRGSAARQAAPVAESVRQAVEKSSLLLRDSSGKVVESGLQVTISVGVASLWEGWRDALQANLVDAADKAMYQAKRSGRNCTVQFSPEADPPYKTIGAGER